MRITATHDGVNFMGLRPKTGDYHLIAEVSKLNNLSGIGAYSNIKNFLALMINESELVLVKASEGQREILANAPVSESKSYLQNDANHFVNEAWVCNPKCHFWFIQVIFKNLSI